MTAETSDVAVRVSGLGKLYKLGAAPGRGSIYDTLARLAGGKPSGPADPHPTIWALRDVSFEVARGEVLGVLGRNGSGKSTLLKILSRITSPTEGEAEVWGRVGALLQVGTGFHPELSGRDNISLSGAVLGMSKREVAARELEIIDFADIGRFIDTAVKHYSSGMFLRLAFSVSAHLATSVMLIDEVLAVGDGAFQIKCRDRIRELVREGRTVVFVSHSVNSVRELCHRCIVLDGGRLVFAGDPESSIQLYTTRILGLNPSDERLPT